MLINIVYNINRLIVKKYPVGKITNGKH
jgi:hypothetical protein